MKTPVLILTQVIYWIFTILSIPYMFSISFWVLTHSIQHPNPGPKEQYSLEIDWPALLIFTVVGACIFYASYVSLKYFIKQPIRFIWIVLFYVFCTLMISLPAELVSQHAATKLGPILYFNVCGFLFRACVEWFKDTKARAALEKDRKASQLELLKAKLDPHFLFSNLNNIDAFIQEDPARASEYLKKLSEILRFMLYETATEKIPLNEEISYIEKYIDLQKIRTANLSYVKLEIKGDATNKKISPMILIHFIENAFKYATNKKVEAAIVIRLDIAGKHLSFYCKNHTGPVHQNVPAKSGLGVQLLKQKLDLIYNKDYKLVTKEENNWYLVHLDIQLDEN